MGPLHHTLLLVATVCHSCIRFPMRVRTSIYLFLSCALLWSCLGTSEALCGFSDTADSRCKNQLRLRLWGPPWWTMTQLQQGEHSRDLPADLRETNGNLPVLLADGCWHQCQRCWWLLGLLIVVLIICISSDGHPYCTRTKLQGKRSNDTLAHTDNAQFSSCLPRIIKGKPILDTLNQLWGG